MLLGADIDLCQLGSAVVILFILLKVPRPTVGVIGKIVHVTMRLTMPIAHACPQFGTCMHHLWLESELLTVCFINRQGPSEEEDNPCQR